MRNLMKAAVVRGAPPEIRASAVLLFALSLDIGQANACNSNDPRCIPTPQYSNQGHYQPSYSGGGGGGGGYNYGAAIGAAGAVIEAAPAAIDLLGGILGTGANVVSGIASTGGNMINQGADTVSRAVPSVPEPTHNNGGPSLSLPNPFKLFNPETANAGNDEKIPDCLRRAKIVGGHGLYRAANVCDDNVTFSYKTSERSFERNISKGDIVFTPGKQTIGKGRSDEFASIAGRPVLVSACNGRGQCYYPPNGGTSDSQVANPEPVPAKPSRQKTAEVKRTTPTVHDTPDTPLDHTIGDFLRSLPGSSVK